MSDFLLFENAMNEYNKISSIELEEKKSKDEYCDDEYCNDEGCDDDCEEDFKIYNKDDKFKEHEKLNNICKHISKPDAAQYAAKTYI